MKQVYLPPGDHLSLGIRHWVWLHWLLILPCDESTIFSRLVSKTICEDVNLPSIYQAAAPETAYYPTTYPPLRQPSLRAKCSTSDPPYSSMNIPSAAQRPPPASPFAASAPRPQVPAPSPVAAATSATLVNSARRVPSWPESR